MQTDFKGSFCELGEGVRLPREGLTPGPRLRNPGFRNRKPRVFINCHPLLPALSGHYSRDWSEYVNVIGVISEPFAREFR